MSAVDSTNNRGPCVRRLGTRSLYIFPPTTRKGHLSNSITAGRTCAFASLLQLLRCKAAGSQLVLQSCWSHAVCGVIHYTGLQQASEGGRFDSGNLPGVTQQLRKLVIHNLSRCIGQTEPKSCLTKSIANHGMQSRSRSKVSLRKGAPIMAELFSKRKNIRLPLCAK